MKKAVLLVSYGTSAAGAMHSIECIEKAVREEFSDADFFRAFSGKMVRKVLEKRGVFILSPEQSLDKLLLAGYDEVFVQPTHLVYGKEYREVRKCAERYRRCFHSLKIGKPLLGDKKDIIRAAEAIAEEYPLKEATGFVFAAHHSEHMSEIVLPELNKHFSFLGREDITAITMDEGKERIAGCIPEQCRDICLFPLMLTAGVHAERDIGNRLKIQLEDMGYTVSVRMTGLGDIGPIQKMYRIHAALLRDEKTDSSETA